MSENLDKYRGKVTISDGAWGTELQAHGLQTGACPDAWNIENPAAVEAVARSYIEAGSEIILTNTFRSNRLALEQFGLADSADLLARKGAQISRKVASNSAAVFGSMGPTGKIVMMGEISPEEIQSSFASQASALEEGGVQAILCETFAQLDELILALRAAKESTNLPVIVSMTFDSGPEKTSTMMGNTPEDLVSAAIDAGADAVGANCGTGPENYAKLAKMLHQAISKHQQDTNNRLLIWIKPNAGIPILREGKTVFPMGPEEFASYVPEIVAAGADFIGGCCGTTPEHIKAIKKVLQK